MKKKENLPIEPVLPALIEALDRVGCAVLQAPPGAGKTTRVPLEMLRAGKLSNKIVMLEPRRLATRAAAERMAQILDEPVGKTVGYRMRGDTKIGPETRIEVVTEGILTRMLQSDPELPDVSAIVFDEFHERSLAADLGLALAWEVKQVLREDLQILVMSATLDAAPVAALLDGAPIVTSEGRSFPVSVHYRKTPLGKERLENAVAETILEALRTQQGSQLVFLPGEAEIRRTMAALAGRLPDDCVVAPLYSALPFNTQRRAIEPVSLGRKIVLSTAIAETSLTIEDIRVVVDAGRSRRARFDPSSGMSRLVTEKVSRAEATQRMGRAGRVAPGVCFRLWTKGEEGALPPFPPAEIEAAELAEFSLELALWGGDGLRFLTPPPAGALEEAKALLRGLEALDQEGRITEHGRRLAALPLHPRLAHMLLKTGKSGAKMAAILSQRDFMRNASADLKHRLSALEGRYEGPGEINHAALKTVRDEAKRLARVAPEIQARGAEEQAALAYPDRIGQRRKGTAPRYILSGGKGAYLAEDDALASSPFLVATDLDGDQREARIRLAMPLSEDTIRGLFADQIETRKHCTWARRDRRVEAREREYFGALVLSDRAWSDPPQDQIAAAMCAGIRHLGLNFNAAANRFRERVALAGANGSEMPDLSDAALIDTLEIWLGPSLASCLTEQDWKSFDPLPALRNLLTWDQLQAVDAASPANFETPLGRKIPIDYASDPPAIALRLQEMFGVTRHPIVAGKPLKVTLLSPAGKPIQVTADIPGFWQSSYADVRKDMRGKYPKHPWPKDPTQADPTLRAKPRRRP